MGVASTVEQHRPVEQYTCGDRTLKLMYDATVPDSFPGLVTLWLCESSSPTSTRDCIMLCANIAQLREWLFLRRDHGTETQQQTQWRRAIEVKARAAIREQSNILGTHLFMVATVGRPDERQFRHLDFVGAWIVDLVGIHTYMGQNRVAIAVSRAIAMKVLTMSDGKLITREEILYQGDEPWLSWICEFTRALLNSPSHNIRPPKP